MKQLILSAVKAGLGEEYPRLRARILAWQDVWTERIKNIRYRLREAVPFDVDPERLGRIKRKNRETLHSFSGWYDPALFARSVCNYGISTDKLHLLDVEIGAETTLSDIVTYHCAGLRAPARYLEIGVSVGKNFVQVVEGTVEGDFTGFDIEDVDPVVTRDLKHLTREEWSSLDPAYARRASGADFSRPSLSSLDIFEDRSGKKKVRYIAGNVFDERCWQVLAREKYDLIFSDAMHTGAAIKHEYSMMKKYNLLGGNALTIIWDDLHFPGMREAFLDITNDLSTTFGADRCSRSLHLVYGWAGRHEGYRHLVGIFRLRA
jgi:hypothetical protein